MSPAPNDLMEKFRAAGQGQVFAFYDRLAPAQQEHLLAEAAEVDLAEVDRLNRTLVQAAGGAAVDLAGLAPAPFEKLPAHGGDAGAWARAEAAGITGLSQYWTPEIHAAAFHLPPYIAKHLPA